MVVRIDFSNLQGHLRNVIINEIEFKSSSKKASNSNNTKLSDVNKYEPKGSNVTDEISLIDESNTHTTYQKINDALIRNRIGDYIAVKHHEEDKVVILKKADAEQQGIYHCRHCGVEFDD